jgi:hypothetical protein
MLARCPDGTSSVDNVQANAYVKPVQQSAYVKHLSIRGASGEFCLLGYNAVMTEQQQL